MDDRKSQLVEVVKHVLIEYVEHYLEEKRKQNISDFLKLELRYDNQYISRLFSSLTGITIEHCVIHLKIEKVMEQLIYNVITLSQIAYQLGYSSVAHLSGHAGLIPTKFKRMKNVKLRLSIDKVGIV